MANCVVRTDLMSGITDASCLEHGRFYGSDGKFAEIQNGSIVQVGALEENERESHKYTDVADGATLTDVVLIAEPEMGKTYRNHVDLTEYINEAGKCIRGYRLHAFDEFSVTADGFKDATAAKVGAFVSVAKNEHILTVGASKPSSGLYIGKIEHVETRGTLTFYNIAVYAK